MITHGDDHDATTARATVGIDWKLIVAALVAFWTISIGLGGLFRSTLLSDVDARIAQHAIDLGEWRTDIAGRITRLEQQCVENTRWRERTDITLDALQEWRHNCSAKMAELQQYKTLDIATIADLTARLSQLEQYLRMPRK